MTIEPITPEVYTRVINAIVRCHELREKHGYYDRNPAAREWRAFSAEMYHSGLLRRLLAGEDPLPEPPPPYSHLRHTIVENGEAYLDKEPETLQAPIIPEMEVHRCQRPLDCHGSIVVSPRPDWECGRCGRMWRLVLRTYGGGAWVEMRGPTKETS